MIPDLRHGSSDKRINLVTYKEGQELAKTIKALFVETSALTQDGLKNCFQTAVSYVFKTVDAYNTSDLNSKLKHNPKLNPIVDVLLLKEIGLCLTEKCHVQLFMAGNFIIINNLTG